MCCLCFADILLYIASAFPVVHYRSLQLLRKNGNRSGEATTLNNIAVVRDNMGDPAQAIGLYQQALTITRELGDQAAIASALGNLGLSYDAAGHRDKAFAVYEEALALARSIGARGTEAVTLSNLGTAHRKIGHYDEALRYYGQALTLVRQDGDVAAEARVLDNMGQALEGQVKPLEALEVYEQSIAAHEQPRANVTLEEFRTSLAEGSAGVYQRAALLRVRLGQPAQAFDIAERARARTFLDQFGNARVDARSGAGEQLVRQEQDIRLNLAAIERSLAQEHARPRGQQNAEVINALTGQRDTLQRTYEDLLARLKISSPQYASLVSVAPATLTQTQQWLDQDTTLLDYFVTPSRTLAFVVTRDTFHAVEISATQAELSAAVNQFRRFDDLSDPAPAGLRQLYGWLVEPVRAYLTTTLVGIVPHGILHYLPFAALPSAAPGHYLGDDYTLFYLPSASVLPFVHGKSHSGEAGALALALSDPPGFEPLQYANQEADGIAALFKGQAMVGNTATETAFDNLAGQRRIAHVAAHGEFNPRNPLFSRILLAPDGANDGSLEVHEVYGLTLQNTDLVTLSACETQLGKQSQGDDIVGLNRAFIYAGAPTVVASLWSVNDEATGVLMQSFYKHLQQGAGKAEALQLAQAETRAKYPHPYYWAAFVLTGDPGAAPAATRREPLWIVAALIVFGAGAWFLAWRARARQ